MRIESWSRQMGMAAIALLSWGAVAQAQINPEAGDEEPAGVEGEGSIGSGGSFHTSTPAQAPTHTETQSSWTPSASSARPAARSTTDNSSDSGAASNPGSRSSDDHAAAVGHLGVGFFGVTTVPLADCGMGANCPNTTNPNGNDVAAPTIGLRYWLGDALGIETALGLNVTSASFGGLNTSRFGFALHGGVPLALAHSGHFVFELVPQVNFGIASGDFRTNTATTKVSGLLVEAGAKVGAEIHFGFIGIPQLSLQGTLGLMVRHESRTLTTPIRVGTMTGTATVDTKQTSFATGVDGSPWDIFRGAITAIYYFY